MNDLTQSFRRLTTLRFMLGLSVLVLTFSTSSSAEIVSSVDNSSSKIVFDVPGALVGAAVMGDPATYDGIEFELLPTNLQSTPWSLASGVTVSTADNREFSGRGDVGGTDQYRYRSSNGDGMPIRLLFDGLDSSETYLFQFGFYYTGTDYSQDAWLAPETSGLPNYGHLAIAQSQFFEFGTGTLPAGYEYAKLNVTVSESTEFSIQLERGTAQSMNAFSLHQLGIIRWLDPGVSNITSTSVDAYATFDMEGDSNAVATLYWASSDIGETNTGWLGTNILGSVSTGMLVNTTISNLTQNSPYVYRFYATNSLLGLEGYSEPISFDTLGAPSVINTGATVSVGQAILHGELTQGGIADVIIYWGRNDGGLTTNYENTVMLPATPQGEFSTTVNVGYGFSNYYYVCYATNALGSDWAPASTNFTMPQPPGGFVYSNGLRGSVFQSTPDNQTPVDMTGASYSNSFTRVFVGDKADTILTMTPSTTPAELPDKNIVLYGNANSWTEFGGSAGDHFVAALSGRFFPQETGSHNFRWSQDDRGWMFLDVDDDGVFDASDTVGSYAWHGNGSKNLMAGQGYNFIFFSQEFGGGDNLAFWYTPPGSGELVVNPTTQSPQWRYATDRLPGEPVIVNSPVSDVASNSVTLNANLEAHGFSVDLYAYWGRSNGLDVAGNWETNEFVGTFHSYTGAISYAATGLASTSQYYYAFVATNAATNIWAQPSGTFGTLGPPVVDNGTATELTQTSATLGASLDAGGIGELIVYWGLTDGGTNASSWENTNSFGEVLQGLYSTNLSVLAGAPYFYRVYGTNSAGEDWADSTATFNTPVPAVSLTSVPLDFQEPDGQSVVTATLSNPSVSNVTVRFSFDASKDSDYTASAASVAITAGTLSSNITLTAFDDTEQEEDETLTVSIDSLVNATNGTPVSVTPTLSSDDPQVTNGSGATGLTESGVTLNGLLTMGDSATVKVFWGDNDGLTNAANWNGTNIMGVQVEDVAFSTNIAGLLANKTYYYRCYSTNASLLGEDWADSSESFGTLTPSVSVGDVRVTEGDSGDVIATFTVTISTLSAIDVSVDYATSNITATAGIDYTATNGTLIIPANTASAAFTVRVTGDLDFEYPDETFTVNLMDPAGCTIADAQGVGTIADDDAEVYLADWSNWMEISLDGYSGTSTLTNWPALVRLSEDITNFVYATFASRTGGDLRFATEDLTRVLNFEIERWDEAGESVVWVQIPELLEGGTSIWAYWNNPGETTLPVYTTNGSTWNEEGFEGVWHMNERHVQDSTAAGNDGTAQNEVADAEGNIGLSQTFDGSGDQINLGNKPEFEQTGNMTLSAWIRPVGTGDRAIMTKWGNNYIYRLTGTRQQQWHINGWHNDNDQLPENAWSFVSFVREHNQPAGSRTEKCYINGVESHSANQDSYQGTSGNLQIGAYGGGSWFNGRIDEARVEGVKRSSDWLLANYSNQVADSTFNSFGPVEGQPLITVVDGATNITVDSAFVTALLTSTGMVPTTTWLYWGDADAGQVAGNWSHTQEMGQATSVPTNYSFQLAPLSDGTEYFYAYMASNVWGTSWAAAGFYTLGSPILNNGSGANPKEGYATLNGNLFSDGGAAATVYTYWGESDGGTNRLSWDTVITNGVLGVGPFSSNTPATLVYGKPYFYRCYATNASGYDAWAPSTESFSPASPLLSGNRLMISFTNHTGGTLTNFPALVKLGASITNFAYSSFLSTNGYDLRFWDAQETTNLNYEIEHWNSNGESIVWVQVPSFTNNCYIWATWGDTASTNREAYTTNGATFSNGFVGVWHLADSVSDEATTGTYRDSSAYLNPGAQYNTGVGDGIAGPCGDFDGNDYILVPSEPQLNHKDYVTASIWVKCVPGGSWYQSWQMFVTKGHDSYWDLRRVGGGDTISFCLNNGNQAGGNTTVKDGDWYQIVGTYSQSPLEAKIYINGQLYHTFTPPGTLNDTTGVPLQISGRDSTASYTHRGLLDELRVSRAYRSADWIKAEYDTIAAHDAFTLYGDVMPGDGVAPIINNGSGATVGKGVATLNGNLLSDGGATATVYTYWGDNDGDTNKLSGWDYVITNGVSGPGAFSSNTPSSLLYGKTYYYRTYATNDGGYDSWAPATTNFMTLIPTAQAPYINYDAGGTLPTGAGVIGSAGDQWNQSTHLSGWHDISSWDLATLDDVAGDTITGAALTITQPAGFLGHNGTEAAAVGSGDTPTSNPLPFDRSVGDAANGMILWTVSGLAVTTYDVYVFWAYDPPTAGSIQVNDGTSQDFTYAAKTADPVEGRDYLFFPTVPASGGEIRILASCPDTNVGVSGFQVARAVPAPSIVNLPATAVTNNSAVLNATLTCPGAIYDVTAYWGKVNAGTNPAGWSRSADLGTYADIASTNLSHLAVGLSPSTEYFFTYRGTNEVDEIWAPNVLSFETTFGLTGSLIIVK